MFVPLRGTLTRRLHTELYEFVWNILSNNSSTENRTDLRLVYFPYLFIYLFIYLSITCKFRDFIHAVNGFNFILYKIVA